MKLYDSPRAPNPRRVRWFMAEKGVTDIEIEEVDILGGAHKRPEYVARAGLSDVPALMLDDETTITESIAICRYLESLYPEPNFFGRDAREAAVIEMWMRRSEMLVANPLMLMVRHTHPALAVLETQSPEVAALNRTAAERGLRLLDRQLSQSEFIAGERVSLADVMAITGLDFARLVKFEPPEGLTHLARWANAMRARPAASAGVP